jgi:hypothetical protein
MSDTQHRAIGWGLSWADFTAAHTLGVETVDLLDALETRFTRAKPRDLIVPDAERRRIEQLPPPIQEPIIQADLLEIHVRADAEIHVVRGPARDLYSVVLDAEQTPCAVLFYPNLTYARAWHRRNDTLDRAFDRDRMHQTGTDAPMHCVSLQTQGFAPWHHDLMDAAGHPVRPHTREAKVAVPAIPHEIRWYLPKLRIFDDQGVLKLRPVLAQWWL